MMIEMTMPCAECGLRIEVMIPEIHGQSTIARCNRCGAEHVIANRDGRVNISEVLKRPGWQERTHTK